MMSLTREDCMTTGIVADRLCREHDPGPEHPESVARFDAVVGALEDAGLWDALIQIKARPASELELRYCHTSDYVSLARQEILEGAAELTGGDTAVCERTWEAALQAAGSVFNAIDAVFRGQVPNAFCVVRPPGHHATPNRGMGFCVFNNIALGARYAQKAHGIQKVMIVDWDVHHGNGTQDIFYEDGSVFVFNTHQSPWYPGTGFTNETGAGAGRGATLNCPLPAGAGRKEFIEVFENRLRPAADAFQPDLIMISAGFDSRQGDPLGGFKLTDGDFSDLTRLVMSIAREHAGGRVVSVLEGGYNLAGLAGATAAHVQALMSSKSN
jgi:acetoin utilization deacetylase AcuC-like enzyme